MKRGLTGGKQWITKRGKKTRRKKKKDKIVENGEKD